MSKTKELIICIISIIALILAVTTNVFASNIPALDDEFTNNTNNADNEFEAIEDTNNNTNTNTNTNTNSNISATTNTNTNTNVNKTATNIPYTGIDYSVVLIIAICGVSAVYAYKKIRDYNV